MLPELLTECYLTQQPWQKFYMGRKDAIKYFEEMINRGNIIAIQDDGILLGYTEFWRLTYEQIGRLMCGAPFWTFDENTTDGNLCYVANIWINPDLRQGLVFRAMEELFFKMNHSAEYYCGFANRKRTKPFKVFKRDQLKSGLFTGANT